MSTLNETEKFIGRGSVGCAFRPPLPCSNHNRKITKDKGRDYIGKVYRSEEVYEREKDIYEKMSEIDPKHKFTARLLKGCPTDMQDFAKHYKNCMRSQDNTEWKNKKSKYQLVIEDGGEDLSKVKLLSQDFIPLLKSFRTIFDGLQIMKKKRWVHQDIKPMNLVFNKTKRRMLLIDFGLAKPMNQIFTVWNMRLLSYAEVYRFYPPEYLAYLDLPVKLRTIKSELYEELNKFIDLSYLSKERRMKQVNDFIRKETRRRTDKDEWYLKYCAPKVDLYSLGMTLLEVIGNFMVQNTNEEVRGIGTTMIERLCFPMINADPFKRMSVEKAKKEYNTIMKQIR